MRVISGGVVCTGRSDGGPSADEAIATARAEAQAAADAEDGSEGAAAEGKAPRTLESCVTSRPRNAGWKRPATTTVLGALDFRSR